MKRSNRLIEQEARKFALLLMVLVISACMGRAPGQPPIAVAPAVDMHRMYGGWYIIATIPNWFEKGLVAPYDIYSPRPDGSIREDFYVRENKFSAPIEHFTVHDWIEPNTNNARWRVQVLWPLRLPFLILYVDPDYRYVVFGEENRAVGWIYARTQTIDDATYASLLDQFRRRGYDATQFRRWVQMPAQIGEPGFWSNGISR